MTTVFLYCYCGQRDNGQSRPVAIGSGGLQAKVACRKKNLGLTEQLPGLPELVL